MKRYILTSLTRNEQLDRLKKLIAKEIKTSDLYYLSSIEFYHVVTRKNGWTIYPSQSFFLNIDMSLTDREDCMELNIVFDIIAYIFVAIWFAFCLFGIIMGVFSKQYSLTITCIVLIPILCAMFKLFVWLIIKTHIEAICKLFDGEAVKSLPNANL